MCYWDTAFVLGPNINAAMDTAVGREAYEAAQKAVALAASATPRERAYVAALAKRYAPTPVTEPPYWHHPIRHSLGAALLSAGKAAEAEAVYRQDLKRFPENGWSLFGLRRSLVAQSKTAEADQVAQRLEKAWRMADVTLTGSRF